MIIVLRDQSNTQTAIVQIDQIKGDLVLGTILSHSFDKVLLEKIKTFQELVDAFVLCEILDEAANALDDYQWTADDQNWKISDFQVFDDTNISFRIHDAQNHILKDHSKNTPPNSRE